MTNSENPDGCGWLIAMVVVGSSFFTLGNVVGFNNGVESMEKKCITANVAEYKLIDDTKETKFVFKGQ